MALLTPPDLLSMKQFLTSFRNEEGFISFYSEAEYLSDTTKRADMNLLGSFLFTKGFNFNNNRQQHDPQQAIGFRYLNLRPMAGVETSVSIQGLYSQEHDLTWAAPGHPPLIAYIDFIDDTPTASWQKDNVIGADYFYTQTFVVRDCRCTNKTITASDDALVQWDLTFTCGELALLPLDANGEYSGGVLTGGSVQPPATLGFGNNFGASFGM